MTNKKYVYSFFKTDALKAVAPTEDAMKDLLGGKGGGLAIMNDLGIPIPPGFTITTEACNDFYAEKEMFPGNMWEQALDHLEKLEKFWKKGFGDPENPLLVSVRSGAKKSMPGMMETVLNVGLNSKTVEGLIKQTDDPGFVFNAYRRLIQMFATTVMGMEDDLFEETLAGIQLENGYASEEDFTETDWRAVTDMFLELYKREIKSSFPEDPKDQLRLSIEAVFKSWFGKSAKVYRETEGISDALGTAVNVQSMVFGNMGGISLTGVGMTRNGATGEKKVEISWLPKSQGEDVVAGTRDVKNEKELFDEQPKIHAALIEIMEKLELHFEDMQDIEFTVQEGVLYLLQTRDGKRSAEAAFEIACRMVEEGLISKETAVQRITTKQVDILLHPQFVKKKLEEAVGEGRLVGKGLNVSPGAAVGMVVLDADLAVEWHKKDKKVILFRPETKTDDVHGMEVSQGICTARGGTTSHASLVARGWGKPAIVGIKDMNFDFRRRTITVGNAVIKEGDIVSVDATLGDLYIGEIATKDPDFDNPNLLQIMEWDKGIKRLGVWTNADTPKDAKRAIQFGAEGIGLFRIEHNLEQPGRLELVRELIMAQYPLQKQEILDKLLPILREDFIEIFRIMNGRPVVFRLIDPPLHEFLPDRIELMAKWFKLKFKIRDADFDEIDEIRKEMQEIEEVLKKVEKLHVADPMMALRGVRLGLMIPELTSMQVTAVLQAACCVVKEGKRVNPKIMIPLVSHVNELKKSYEILESAAKIVFAEEKIEIDYKAGTMIEVPRAALTAYELATIAEFFSFGTNDKTQMTFGMGRDAAEEHYLVDYLQNGLFEENPFESIDEKGVGRLMKIAMEDGRRVNPELECGICGEHGGDPKSIEFCHKIGLTYVSCSPARLFVAIHAAALAVLADEETDDK